MKAIIPVAGAGKSLRPLTYTQPKPLIPVAGKPIISYILDELIEVGISEFIFVLGYMGENVRDYLEKNYQDISRTYIYQESREGLGHAIYLAKEHIEDEQEIFIALGDTIFEVNLEKMIDCQDSILAIKKVEDPREFGVVELDENHYVRRAVEKPTIPTSNKAIVGLYKLKNIKLLLDCLEQIIKEDKRNLGEYQLTDALMCMIEKGELFRTVKTEQWFDCGRKEILLQTNQLLLQKSKSLTNSEKCENTIVIPPIFIGKNCTIKNSIIGPHVTIGDNCTLDQVIIKESIIGNYAILEEVVLRDSVIGNDTAIKGIQQSLNLGDNTQIDFSS